MFIVVDGVSKFEKSKILNYLKSYFKHAYYSTIFTSEIELNNYFKSISKFNIDVQTKFLISHAAKMQYYKDRISYGLSYNQYVISDGFISTSYAYFGYGDGLSLNMMYDIVESTIGNVIPDFTFYTTVTVNDLLRDKQITQSQIDYYNKVLTGYSELSRLFPNWVILDSKKSLDSQLKNLLDKKIKPKFTNSNVF